MSRPWLRPFTAGAAVVAAASVAAWAYAAFRQPSDLIVVQYVKPTGLHPPPQPVDPAPRFESASHFLVAVAKQCGLRSWELETEGIANDADDVARLETDLNRLSDQNFNCLVRAAKPPQITVERKSN